MAGLILLTNLLGFQSRRVQVTGISSSPELPYTTYIPLLAKSIFGLYGKVTENGLPAANVLLTLRFYSGSSWSTAATTTTSADGSYLFTNVSSLGPGQSYYVLYSNGENGNPNRLWTWHTKVLQSYQSESFSHAGDFDLANIDLISPYDNSSVTMPAAFHWTPRPATPTDSYEFNLYNPYDIDTYFFTEPPLGYVGTYMLNGLPPGFQRYTLYVWDMWVYSPDGGFGISYQSLILYFTGPYTNPGLLPGASVIPRRTLTDLEAKK